jgi:hypothetical protein
VLRGIVRYRCWDIEDGLERGLRGKFLDICTPNSTNLSRDADKERVASISFFPISSEEILLIPAPRMRRFAARTSGTRVLALPPKLQGRTSSSLLAEAYRAYQP